MKKIATTVPDNDGVLTLEKLEAAFNYWQSDEYRQEQNDRAMRTVENQRLIRSAFEQDVITETEALVLSSRIENGYLMVTPDMWRRLKDVKLPDQPQ